MAVNSVDTHVIIVHCTSSILYSILYWMKTLMQKVLVHLVKIVEVPFRFEPGNWRSPSAASGRNGTGETRTLSPRFKGLYLKVLGQAFRVDRLRPARAL